MRAGLLSVLILLVAGCASTPDATPPSQSVPAREAASGGAETERAARRDDRQPTPVAREAEGSGLVDVDVSDVAGHRLPSRVELQTTDGGRRQFFEIPTGVDTIRPHPGSYYAFVYVYDNNVPIMVHAQELEVTEGAPAYILVNLLEGASGKLSIHDFDQDNDLAIDKVELIAGTDPTDPRSIPGRPRIQYDTRVFSNEDRWYRGELHAISNYGGGQESVAELVARAEKAGLDFLAIADLNTMESVKDPGFRSDSVVLIPAMAWGTADEGIALIYGPATVPDPPYSREAAQAECFRIQNQGGVFAIAHPTSPEAPWRWGLGYVNAVQVWSGPWRDAPPLYLSDLSEDDKIRDGGKLVHSIAAAAAVSEKTAHAAAAARRQDVGVSANDQAALFWDYELVRGSVSSPIAGGRVDRRTVPMGQPVTWVRASNKSVDGIVEGLRMGRTFVSNKLGGVEIGFGADALVNGIIDVGPGGAVPLRIEVAFQVVVYNANGAKVQVLRNGHPVLTKIIESNGYAFAYPVTTDFPSNYRVRVIRQPDNPGKGYGPVEVLALSAPIYAADIGTELLRTGPLDIDKAWIRLESEYVPDDPRVPR